MKRFCVSVNRRWSLQTISSNEEMLQLLAKIIFTTLKVKKHRHLSCRTSSLIVRKQCFSVFHNISVFKKLTENKAKSEQLTVLFNTGRRGS